MTQEKDAVDIVLDIIKILIIIGIGYLLIRAVVS